MEAPLPDSRPSPVRDHSQGGGRQPPSTVPGIGAQEKTDINAHSMHSTVFEILQNIRQSAHSAEETKLH
jgi:hypothetical protein